MNLEIQALRGQYASGLKPAELIDRLCEHISSQGEDHVWIHRLGRAELRDRARALEDGPRDLPLYGIPFAVKDNMDVAGLPTTAGCPAFAYTAAETATVVTKLLNAGAILVGKTNLDQFATGLVGVRSPYGVPRNPFDARLIPGGSSSGSAVAVSAGLVSFALGTDTAGSGRVPAAFNNIVGLKPTRGLLSTYGIVPACRTIDCVSVFALTCENAEYVAHVAAGFDPTDPFSRRESGHFESAGLQAFEFGVPDQASLQFFGDVERPVLFANAVAALEELGGKPVIIDYAPFREAANLLYSGPWVAERAVALRAFLATQAGNAHPITRKIIEGAGSYSATDTFEAIHCLAALQRRIEPVWERIAVLLLPTAGTVYSVAQVEADPIQLNSNLGHYTNFVNLLDCCAVAVPAGFDSRGAPFGVTLVARSQRDGVALAIAGRLHRRSGLPMGATRATVPVSAPSTHFVSVAVVGAHLRGLPLNHQLLEHGAQFVRQCRTAPCYRLYKLTGTDPPKPGLVRTSGPAASIEVEVWEMPSAEFGRFVNQVPSPLAIGTILLDSGEAIKGFVCEPVAIADACDISGSGGWRQFLRGQRGDET